MEKFLLLALLLVMSVRHVCALEGRISNGRGMIGIRSDWDHRIVKVYRQSPAWKAGLRSGDLITKVDGDKKNEIVGEAYTDVIVTVDRNGKELSFIIERKPPAEIKQKHYEYLRDHEDIH